MTNTVSTGGGGSWAADRKIDPITYEVLSNAFTAVVDDMGAMLEKVSFSTAVSIGKDYVCAMVTPSGRSSPAASAACHDDRNRRSSGSCRPCRDRRRGHRRRRRLPLQRSVHGRHHAQDVTTVRPVFVGGELACFVLSAAHWPDVGGPVAGSFNSEATSSHAEALLMTPIHIIREGRTDTSRWNA
ncbi:MAG: hydantoinase B/oxoprolinase family protein [Actinomycetota bacterium]